MGGSASSSKGRYLEKVVVSTATGPGIPVVQAVTRNFANAYVSQRRATPGAVGLTQEPQMQGKS